MKKIMEKISSVSDFLLFIQEHNKIYQEKIGRYFSDKKSGPSWYKYKPNFWFRGHADATWELQPKVERSSFIEAAKNAGDIKTSYEYTILNQFLIRSLHLLSSNLSLTEKYFLAQHHGLPTRLLDWSTNPLVALFFASLKHKNENCKETNGAIYILWARGDYSGADEEDIIYQNNEKIVNSIKSIYENVDYTIKAKYPIRVIPNAQLGRILSQSSRFTFHPANSASLENELNRNLYKFEILSGIKKDILEELSVLNINWSTLFPDLDHMVKEIKYQTNIE